MQPRSEGARDDDSWEHPLLPRLLRFYKYYSPSKLVVANDMLKDAIGNEESLFEALRRKYGPEPDPLEERRPPDTDNHRKRLVRFYQKYNPDKIHEVGQLLSSFKGREDALFAALTEKYGPEPSDVAGEPLAPDVLRMLDENKRLKHKRQADVLWTISENHKARTYRTYYYKWLECLWWRKNRGVMESVISEGRTNVLSEQQHNQQLREQVEFLRDKIKRFDQAKRREAELQMLPPPQLQHQPPPQPPPQPQPLQDYASTDALSNQLSQVLSQQQFILKQQAEQQEILQHLRNPVNAPKTLLSHRSSMRFIPSERDKASVGCGVSQYQPTEADRMSVGCGRSAMSSPVHTPHDSPRNSMRRRSRASFTLPALPEAQAVYDVSPDPTEVQFPTQESPIEWKPGYEPHVHPEIKLPAQHGITQQSTRGMHYGPPPPLPRPHPNDPANAYESGHQAYAPQGVGEWGGYPPNGFESQSHPPDAGKRQEVKSAGKDALVQALLNTHPMVQQNADLKRLLDIKREASVPAAPVAAPPAAVPAAPAVLGSGMPPPFYHDPYSHMHSMQGYTAPSKYETSSEASTRPSIHVHLPAHPSNPARLSSREKSRIVDDLVKEITGKKSEKPRRKKR